MNYQEALAFMSKAKDITKGRPTGQRGTRLIYDLHYETGLPVVTLKYHNTYLVQWTHDNTLFMNSGWCTPTTKKRLNEQLKDFNMGIVQRNYMWYLQRMDEAANIEEWSLSSYFLFSITPEGELKIKH